MLTATGTFFSIIANRVSYFLDLLAPALPSIRPVRALWWRFTKPSGRFKTEMPSWHWLAG
ncbi:MAG: hypothetical protein DMG06_23110 [Acidobacteria bacterium]|nr:MAG: hypothetical protein DMG06_23110 [Acidobacteriota bacterium]